jgi:hypothetical protein
MPRSPWSERWNKLAHCSIRSRTRSCRRPNCRPALRIEALERRNLLSLASGISFPGIDEYDSQPPDPTLAAGPENLLTMVNSQIGLYSKTGTQLELADLDQAFGGNNGFFEDVDAEYGSFDPWATYDRYSDRYIVVAEEVEYGSAVNGVRGGYGADEAYLLIGVSTSSAPDDLDVAPGDTDNDWHVYSIPATHDFGNGQAWIDYPKITADADSIYITGKYHLFGDRSFQGVVITRLDKGPMLSGSLGARTDIEVPDTYSTYVLQPALSVGRDAADPQLFVQRQMRGDGLLVWELNDANALTPFSGGYSPYSPFYGEAPQPVSSSGLDTHSAWLMNAVWRDDTLWTAHTVEVDSEATVRWYEIDTTAGYYSLTQSGDIDPGAGVHTFMPGIAVDGYGNMGITYTQSSEAQYATMMITGRESGAPAGTTEPGVAVQASTTYYEPTGATEERWGDYAGIAVDPSDDRTFWAFHEVVGASSSTWTTHFGSFTLESDLVFDADDDPAPGSQKDDGTPDTFVLTRNGANLEVTINGSTLDPLPISGIASVTVNGSTDTDTFTVNALGADFDGDVVVNGQSGGGDVASLYDSSGDDSLTADSSQALLTIDGGYTATANNCSLVHAYATGGGTDEAELTDSSGNDSLTSMPYQNYAKLKFNGSSSNFVRVKFFDTVEVSANAGDDSAYLWGGTASDDTFSSYPHVATMVTSNGFDATVNNFEIVVARGGAQGLDVASFRDSTGNDIFDAWSTEAKLRYGGAADNYAYASGFEYVHAYANYGGGTDVAHLYDTTGDDIFTSRPASNYAKTKFYGNNNHFARVRFFDEVHAHGGAGGNDVAYLYDTSGNDQLVAEDNEATLNSGVFDTTVYDFGTVYANSSQGGTDTTDVTDPLDFDLILTGYWDE